MAKIQKKKKVRVYRLDDLADMAAQLGGRIHFQIFPMELAQPQAPQKDAPDKSRRKSKVGSR